MSHSLKLLLFGCLICLSQVLKAQDVIVMKSGEELSAKVIEVGQSDIKYKDYKNLSGPTYTLAKDKVFMIRYENGQKDVFQQSSPTTSAAPAPAARQGSQQDVTRARSSAVFGYVISVPILALGIAGSSSEDSGTGIALGGAATLIGGIGIPIVYGGGHRTRINTGVDGSPGLRIAGWVGYAIAMGDAVYLIALSSAGEDTQGAGTPVAVLGCASAIFMAADAGKTANQAEEALDHASNKPRLFIGSMRNPSGKAFPTLGLALSLDRSRY